MITVPKIVIRGINEAALASYPEECCGLLEGCSVNSALIIKSYHPSNNLASNPRKEFEIDPLLRISLQRKVRERANKVVGLYHSHPEGHAYPSPIDVARAWESDLIWLIASVKRGFPVKISAFTIKNSEVSSLSIANASNTKINC